MLRLKYKLLPKEFEIEVDDDIVFECKDDELDDYINEQIQEYLMDNYNKLITRVKD